MRQIKRFLGGPFWFVLAFLFSVGFSVVRNGLSQNFAILSQAKNHSIDDQRNIYKTFDSEDQNDQGIPVDPFDLMKRLKQAGEMNDATSPSDAIDEALNAFIESEYENVPIE